MAPAVTGTATVGGTLSAGTGTWTDADKNTLTYSYQWYRATDSGGTGEAAINGATSASYTLTPSDAHKYVKVVVTANDANGSTTQTSESAYTAITNTAPVNSVVPAVTGTTIVGNALSAGTGTWSDADSDTVTFSYQWYRADSSGGTSETAITGATAASYTLTSPDANKDVRVVVTANDANGSTTQTTTSAFSSIANSVPVNTTIPLVTGTTSVGGALTAGTGSWSNTDSDVTYTYQWYRSDDSGGTNEAAISGATSASYTPTLSDAHKNLRVVVTAANSQGRSVQTAASSRTVVANSNPVNITAPAVTGTAAIGGTLSAGTGTWSDGDSDTLGFTYQWYRSDDSGGANETAISGATAASYSPTAADAHKFVRVVVTANDANGSTTQTTSSARPGVANTVPSLTTPATLTLTDTAGADSLGSQTGKLTAADTDTDGLTFGITGGTAGSSFTAGGVTYDVSRTGTYGTLHLNSVTGAYVSSRTAAPSTRQAPQRPKASWSPYRMAAPPAPRR